MSDPWPIEGAKLGAQFAMEGVKALAFVNGGAVVAILTFIGNTAKTSTSATHIDLHLAANSLRIFAAGLVFGLVTWLSAFQTFQGFIEATDSGDRRGNFWLKVSLGASSLSLALFIAGSWVAAEAFP